MRIFLLADKRVHKIDRLEEVIDADFLVVNVQELFKLHPVGFPVRNIIVLDFGDLYGAKVGLRREDEEYRNIAKGLGLTYIYLEGEDFPIMVNKGIGTLRRLYQGDDNFIKLSIPLGYPAGGKMNLNYPDNDTSAHHINNLTPNPKEYDYDFCWIGAESGPYRTAVLRQLYQAFSGNGLWTNISNSNLDADYSPELPAGGFSKILIKSNIDINTDMVEHRKNIHADNKTIPYNDYIDYHRRSKVNLSCHGISKFNYMDGEYFANNCFNLRQYHKDLSSNPFSPIDGKHWVAFKDDELLDKIDYYSNNEEEREVINDAGHKYFKEAITGGWAKHYVDMLLEYKHTGSTDAFRKVGYGAHV